MPQPVIKIAWLGGNCPVQAEGSIDGELFYFRARGNHWSLGIGDDPVVNPVWSHEEPYGEELFAAGWMDEDEALAFIHKAAKQYMDFTRQMALVQKIMVDDHDILSALGCSRWYSPLYPRMLKGGERA